MVKSAEIILPDSHYSDFPATGNTNLPNSWTTCPIETIRMTTVHGTAISAIHHIAVVALYAAYYKSALSASAATS